MRAQSHPELDSGFKRYIQEYGMPMRVYLDKHTTYKSNAKPQVEDALNNTKPFCLCVARRQVTYKDRLLKYKEIKRYSVALA